MSLFPPEFDPGAEIIHALHLVEIDTPDGPFGFILGVDGLFMSIDGRKWFGSQLLQPGDDEFAIGGNAPSGSITLSWFQDPQAPDLIGQIRDLGVGYIEGRELTFYVQPLRGAAEFSAPTLPPVQVMTRTMRRWTVNADQAQGRSMALHYESVFEARKGARRRVYNTEDHGRLVGAANPSLQFIPQTTLQEQKLFG